MVRRSDRTCITARMHAQRRAINTECGGQTLDIHATELARALELGEPVAQRPWTSRLVELGLVSTTGRTRATRYYVEAGAAA